MSGQEKQIIMDIEGMEAGRLRQCLMARDLIIQSKITYQFKERRQQEVRLMYVH